MKSARNHSRLIPLDPDDFPVGEPAPYAVFDSNGRLLLSRGQILASRQTGQRLFAGGLFRHPGTIRLSGAESVDFGAVRLDPFEALRVLRRRTQLGLDALLDGLADAPAFIDQLSMDMNRLLDRAIDPVIGVAHLHGGGHGAAAHQLFSGLFSNLLARWLGYAAGQRHSLTCAALTNNVALMPIQNTINERRGELSEEDRERLRRHASDSADLLRSVGVADAVWLNVVMQSHERWDGSGYPRGLHGAEIIPEARALGVVDAYLAMISQRAYRAPLAPPEALREIYTQGGSTDKDICSVFVKHMGLYPPGSCVRLANGELAVVTARTPDTALDAQVHAICSASGSSYAQPIFRSSDEPGSAITESVLLRDADLPDPRLFWQAH